MEESGGPDKEKGTHCLLKLYFGRYIINGRLSFCSDKQVLIKDKQQYCSLLQTTGCDKSSLDQTT